MEKRYDTASPQVKEKPKKPVAPVYLLGATWVLYAIFLPLYRPLHFLICTFASLIVYQVAKQVFAPRERDESKKPEVEIPTRSGDRQVDEMLKEGQDFLKQLRELGGKIENTQVKTSIHLIEQTGGRIFEYLARNPKQAPQLRKFMNYYLPTLVKLLTHYETLERQTVDGPNIVQSKQKIEEMLKTVSHAFDQQLDSLFGETALDISTDITVLEGMLAGEGLTNNIDRD